MNESQAVRDARAQAERSRARLMATAQELQHRVSPRTIARGAWEGAKEKSADLAENAVDAVASRPVAVGAVATLAAVFIAREPLMNLAGRLFNWDSKAGSGKDERKRIHAQTDGSGARRGGHRAG